MLLLAAVREELGDLEGEIVGIGPVLAAIRTAALVERHRPDSVLLIGTAGAYPGGPEIGQAVIATTVGLSPGVAAMGLGYVPRQPKPVSCDPAITDALNLLGVRVLSVGAVTTDVQLSDRLSDGWDVEHMEAFGVALACQEAGVPFAAIMGIASRVGPENHTLWLTHRTAAQHVCRQAIAPLFGSSE